jgi:hypothetical protein
LALLTYSRSNRTRSRSDGVGTRCEAQNSTQRSHALILFGRLVNDRAVLAHSHAAKFIDDDLIAVQAATNNSKPTRSNRMRCFVPPVTEPLTEPTTAAGR